MQRILLKFFSRLFISGMVLLFGCSAFSQSSHEYYLLIGTYNPANHDAVFVYRFNTETGKADSVSAMDGVENPSFLVISPDHHHVYTVSETHGPKGGGVYAYSFDEKTGHLKYIDHQLSEGTDPCHINEDKTEHWVMVANYSSGSLSVLPIEPNGGVGPVIQHIQHTGHGVNPERQEGPHVHFVNIAPNNKDVFVSDLGLDKVFTYELNVKTGHLSDGNPPFVKVTPGAGPRHQVISPDDKYLYLIQEMGHLITAFRYTPGKLTPIQTLPSTPPGFKGFTTGADILISPDGKYLYASNRDSLNDLTIYARNMNTGLLTYKGSISSGGKTPRNFVITPDGRYILVGHQNSNDIIVFRRNEQTGMLTNTGYTIPIAHAVCLMMIPYKG
jgi:6-phosphogluconolactonase